MKNKNICKFITSDAPEWLETSNFIYESNSETMGISSLLPCHRLLLVTDGEGSVTVDGGAFDIKTGDLFFTFRSETVSAAARNGLKYIYISFNGARADALFRRLDISSENRCFHGHEGLIPFWHESLSRADESNIDLAAESALLYALSRISKEHGRTDNFIARAVELLEESFSDPDFNLSALADELGYNKKYISHAFKEKKGVGITEYLRDLRIKHAVFLLEHGLDSVKNVAYLSGYRDPLYFSSVFKRIVGVSPKDYKNSKASERS